MSTKMAESTLLDYGTMDTGDHGKPAATADGPRPAHEIGAIYEPEFLDQDESKFLLNLVDGKPWSGELKRRVQHYGWKYDYSSRFITEDMRAEPLPYFIHTIAEMLTDRGWFRRLPDQVIVNDAEPSVDRDCFGPTQHCLSAIAGQCSLPGRDRGPAGRPEGAGNRLRTGSARNARQRWTHGIALQWARTWQTRASATCVDHVSHCRTPTLTGGAPLLTSGRLGNWTTWPSANGRERQRRKWHWLSQAVCVGLNKSFVPASWETDTS